MDGIFYCHEKSLDVIFVSDLFYACREEAADISFMQALYRILTLAADQLKQLGAFCEKTATAFFDAIMDTALQCIGLSKNKVVIG